MKKTILGFTVILLMCIGGMGISPVRAYTVTVLKDGMYAETIPDAVIDNAPVLFQNQLWISASAFLNWTANKTEVKVTAITSAIGSAIYTPVVASDTMCGII